MEYVIKPHAKKRMQERGISELFIQKALAYPTAIEYDENNRALIKKQYYKKGKRRLVLIVGERVGGVWEVVTVIDTSKVDKYV